MYVFHVYISVEKSMLILIILLYDIVYYVYANFSYFYLGIFCLRSFCLLKRTFKLSKKCLILFGNNSVNVWILCISVFI